MNGFYSVYICVYVYTVQYCTQLTNLSLLNSNRHLSISGYLKTHKAAAYSRAKCNWMKIRKPKHEPELYCNGKTGEVTAEMPEVSCIHTYIHIPTVHTHIFSFP